MTRGDPSSEAGNRSQRGTSFTFFDGKQSHVIWTALQPVFREHRGKRPRIVLPEGFGRRHNHAVERNGELDRLGLTGVRCV